MLEIAMGIGLCVVMARLAAASRRSPGAWAGIAIVACAASILIPLPFIRFLIAGVVVFVATSLTNKASGCRSFPEQPQLPRGGTVRIPSLCLCPMRQRPMRQRPMRHLWALTVAIILAPAASTAADPKPAKPGGVGSMPADSKPIRSRPADSKEADSKTADSKGADSKAADFIWVEGEAAGKHGMVRHGWYDSVTKGALSGGEWLSHFAAGDPPEAEYAVEAPRAGTYRLWIRCNTVARPRLSCRLGGGAWKEVDLSRAVGAVNIASDGKPDMRFVAWVDAGEVDLARGTNVLRLRFHSENQNHGAVDCFVLTRRPFRPRGALKPGERSGKANPSFFAWEPDVDPFGPEALVDLRSLNEKTAGEKGRVRAKGNDFVLASGEKVKFWAANAGPGIWGLDDAAHVYLAGRLAKCGVNMVRLHGALYGSRDPKIDRGKLDRLHHMVHALRDEGIYVALSFYFPLWFSLDEDRRPFMLLFFDEEMQRIYFEWADALLTTPNPHAKLPLGRDPAVAMVEVVNEDSHFFWTFGKKNATEARWRKLQALFGEWLEARHGSIEKAYEAWGGVREAGDDPGSGRVDLYGAWEMTTQGIEANPRKAARVSDQVRFLTENMRGFYEKAIRHFRKECRYEGLVSCGNWHVADPAKLDALERYCYTAGDVIDHHGYFDHGHTGDAASWSVRPGQEFTSQSAIRLEHPNPIPYVETDGYPHIISEVGWPMPNAYRSEFTFLASAYGALQGLDGIFSFAIGSEGWDERAGKFALSTPATLGCFPAAALAYRRGYVQEAPTVVLDRLALEDLLSLKGSGVFAAGALDRFRAEDIPPGEERRGAVEGIDPLTFYVGRVARSFAGKPAESVRRGVGDRIDREAKVVRSITGELALDYGRGVVTLDAPRAQGAAGFLGRVGPVKLGRATIEMKNDYGAITVVAMDDLPLERSRKILVQCMTVEQFHGFRASGPGNFGGRIEDVGSAPIGVERFQAVVTLRLEGAAPPAVVACDEHGYPTDRRVATSGGPEAFAVTLDPTSPYHVVKR